MDHNQKIDEQIKSLEETITYLQKNKRYYCPTRKITIDPDTLATCSVCSVEDIEGDMSYCDNGHHVCHNCLIYCNSFIPMETCDRFSCRKLVCYECRKTSRICTEHIPPPPVSAFANM